MIFVFFSTNCASYFWYFKDDVFVKFSQRFVFDRHKALEMKPCSHFCVFYSLPVNQNWSRRPFDMFAQCLARLNEMSNLDYWQQNMLCNKYFLLKIVILAFWDDLSQIIQQNSPIGRFWNPVFLKWKEQIGLNLWMHLYFCTCICVFTICMK